MDRRAGWYSIGVNVILFALNLTMAYYSNSLALKAETAHNLLDLIASISILIGVILSQRKTRNFPYGMYKIENVVAVFISLAMFVTGYEIAHESLFAPPHTPDVRPIMLAGVVVAAVIPLVFSQYEMRLGRTLNSPSLIADAMEYRAHILSSTVVFAALAGQLFGVPLDRFASLIIVIWVAYMGWRTLVDGMRVLLDASLDPFTLNAVRAIILANPIVVRIKSLTGRNSGRYRFIEGEVVLRINDLNLAHSIVSGVEHEIKSEIPHVERVLIHFESEQHEIVRLAVPLTASTSIVAEDFGKAIYFGIFEIRAKDDVILQQDIKENPYQTVEKGRGLKIAEWLINQKVDVVVSREDLSHKGSGFALSASGVKIIKINSDNLNQALPEILRA
jgi:cation diffusion facilitator family transporter